MLSLAIPEFRLPKTELKRDMDFILAHGVRLETNRRVDHAASLLEKGFRAVFVATGAQTCRRLDIPGEELDGVVDSLKLLRARALGQAPRCRGHVAVIGGGNAAVDAARSARRLGADRVTIFYRRTREEMPAYEEEIQAAIEEGIELVTLVSPTRVLGTGGRVSGLELQRMSLGAIDDGGRRRPVAVPDSLFTVDCDMVLPAVGQVASLESLAGVAGVNLGGGRGVRVHPVSQEAGAPGIFAGGDCVSGGGTVIEAIAQGQRAATAIDRFLGGTGSLPPDTGLTFRRPSEEELESAAPRVCPRELPAGKRTGGFDEVVLGIEREEALREALRCLRCDLEHHKR
jgi:NADPH-dependent glutamate synthase beta subunit-like oxidoreductase